MNKVLNCGRRGVYGYQNNTLRMTDCTVRGTEDPTRSAVEAAGGREGDSVDVSIKRCTVHSNKGAGIRLRGAVAYRLEENECTGSGEGDLHMSYCEENGSWPKASCEPTGKYDMVQNDQDSAGDVETLPLSGGPAVCGQDVESGKAVGAQSKPKQTAETIRNHLDQWRK
ncbi:unnamed protein product [Polarella glacialis]|uniref:Right handed beta helix domain-containing protein n=1 Tax=Polarella glacialis TaxID=89957 RepID=A0A813JHH7_POLGL|nr:unnamed protein product [Polarella glacialis]